MHISEKLVGASVALLLGSTMFLAPAAVTGGGEGPRTLPVDIARAEPDIVAPALLEAVSDADDAWSEAALAIERSGQTPARVAGLEAADDALFHAVIAMEMAREEARQIARIEKADDEYFEAATLIELTGGTAEQRASLEAADSAYFDAVLALEESSATRVRLAQMQTKEKPGAATRLATENTQKLDDVVTGSLPKDSAAAIAANPMTARILRDETGEGLPAIEAEEQGDVDAAPEAAAAAGGATGTVETVGAIAPTNLKPPAKPDAAKPPAPAVSEVSEEHRASARAAAPAKPVHARRVAQPVDTPIRFRDRGPVAKVFRIFVMGIGFIPSRL